MRKPGRVYCCPYDIDTNYLLSLMTWIKMKMLLKNTCHVSEAMLVCTNSMVPHLDCYLWWKKMSDWVCGYWQGFPGSIWLLQETNPSSSKFLGVAEVVTLCLGCCFLFTLYMDIEWVARLLQSLLFGSLFNTHPGSIDQDTKEGLASTSMSTTNCTFREPRDGHGLCLQTLWTWFEFGFSKDSLWMHPLLFPSAPHLTH